MSDPQLGEFRITPTEDGWNLARWETMDRAHTYDPPRPLHFQRPQWRHKGVYLSRELAEDAMRVIAGGGERRYTPDGAALEVQP